MKLNDIAMLPSRESPSYEGKGVMVSLKNRVQRVVACDTHMSSAAMSEEKSGELRLALFINDATTMFSYGGTVGGVLRGSSRLTYGQSCFNPRPISPRPYNAKVRLGEQHEVNQHAQTRMLRFRR